MVSRMWNRAGRSELLVIVGFYEELIGGAYGCAGNATSRYNIDAGQARNGSCIFEFKLRMLRSYLMESFCLRFEQRIENDSNRRDIINLGA